MSVEDRNKYQYNVLKEYRLYSMMGDWLYIKNTFEL